MAPVGLPPGFRFHPTDEELVNYYLKRKIHGHEIELDIIPEVDLYKCEPWDLAEKSFLPSRDPEWYFFGPRDRKYPNGFRTNRATRAGYWKSTGKDRRVSSQNRAIGMKKTLVYYRGRAPQGIRTDWVMHEYRLDEKECEDASGIQDSYALCRVFKKNGLCSEVEDQLGQPSNMSLLEYTHGITMIDHKTLSPDFLSPSSSSAAAAVTCIEEEDKEDKDESWMQFIQDEVWCSSKTTFGGEEVSQGAFINYNDP
ncbi:NAC domain-containing protein 54-like [Andrographis paniculata]|uniref:NAC domain-containing protein 54-like n=1 Tax=Andrographis paniculata TaxID=175694 RepID=UPI0021E947DD|nr:NAC domain-containing protein 54-like [Andrographis paniculata]